MDEFDDPWESCPICLRYCCSCTEEIEVEDEFDDEFEDFDDDWEDDFCPYCGDSWCSGECLDD